MRRNLNKSAISGSSSVLRDGMESGMKNNATLSLSTCSARKGTLRSIPI